MRSMNPINTLPVDQGTLLEWYEDLMTARMLDQHMASVANTTTFQGGELVPLICSEPLEPGRDRYFPHGVTTANSLARGVSPANLMVGYLDRAHWNPPPDEDRLVEQARHSGASERDGVTLLSVPEGPWLRSLRDAASDQALVIVISSDTEAERHPDAVTVDGSDPIALLNVIREAVDVARSERRLVTVVALVAQIDGRMGPAGPDELMEWRHKDPLRNLRQLMIEERILTEDQEAAITSRAEEATMIASASSRRAATGISGPQLDSDQIEPERVETDLVETDLIETDEADTDRADTDRADTDREQPQPEPVQSAPTEPDLSDPGLLPEESKPETPHLPDSPDLPEQEVASQEAPHDPTPDLPTSDRPTADQPPSEDKPSDDWTVPDVPAARTGEVAPFGPDATQEKAEPPMPIPMEIAAEAPEPAATDLPAPAEPVPGITIAEPLSMGDAPPVIPMDPPHAEVPDPEDAPVTQEPEPEPQPEPPQAPWLAPQTSEPSSDEVGSDESEAPTERPAEELDREPASPEPESVEPETEPIPVGPIPAEPIPAEPVPAASTATQLLAEGDDVTVIFIGIEPAHLVLGNADVISVYRLQPIELGPIAASIRKTSKPLIVTTPVTKTIGDRLVAHISEKLEDWLDAEVEHITVNDPSSEGPRIVKAATELAEY